MASCMSKQWLPDDVAKMHISRPAHPMFVMIVAICKSAMKKQTINGDFLRLVTAHCANNFGRDLAQRSVKNGSYFGDHEDAADSDLSYAGSHG